MKSFISFVLFIFGALQLLEAQVVNITDTAFYNKLLYSNCAKLNGSNVLQDVDSNNDGLVQLSEATAVTYLNVSSPNGGNIADMDGVQSFTNLDTLKCTNHHITNLPISGLTGLLYLDCSYNQVSSLGIAALTNLRHLACGDNLLTSLSVVGLPNLQELLCRTNALSTLAVSQLTGLTTLDCSSNQLTVLDVSLLSNLVYLDCGYNQLAILDISSSSNLLSIYCEDNQLASILFPSPNQIENLICAYNLLQTLSTSSLTHLFGLECSYNQLTSLDVSASSHLNGLICRNNALTYLLLKNGSNEASIMFSGNPNLNYICADDMQIVYLQQLAQSYLMTNVAIGSFCSFSPEGNHNTLSGNSLYDIDANGCTVSDIPYPFLKFKIVSGANIGYSYSNEVGHYNIYLDSLAYTITPQLQNPAYYTLSPTTFNTTFPNNNNNLQTQDICIVANGTHPDVEITLMELSPPRPGFDADYSLLFDNKGTSTLSGDITLDFMGNKLTFVSSNPNLASQTTNQLTWNYTNLLPFESRQINFTLHVLPPPTNNVGDSIGFQATISPVSTDAVKTDNVFTSSHVLVGSFDPNDKTCLEGDYVSTTKIGNYLHYLIRFQNTGTYLAENVVVVDSIDVTQFDYTSPLLLAASNPVKMKIQNKVLQFYFENIMLPDSFSNEPASHGYVSFKVRTKSSLVLGASVSNRAAIYFDYNAPVITNNAITTFVNSLGIVTPEFSQFQLYPNPAQTELIIESIAPLTLEILNSLGENVGKKSVLGTEKWDISYLPSGLYWIKDMKTNVGRFFMKD